MSGSILINLTDRECDVLAEMSRELDLPQERVMIQALRHYQASRQPMPSLTMMVESDFLCVTCGIGYRLPSGRCDHCDRMMNVNPVQGGEVARPLVDEAFVESVESEVGMGHNAWDMVDPARICEAILKVAKLNMKGGA